MVDSLYGELESSAQATFAEHLSGCDGCRAEFAAHERTRSLAASLPDEEPAPRIATLLLHEAAQRPSQRGGWFARAFNWLFPVVRHPAVAAVACLVLVAGVAGTLYLRGDVSVVKPAAPSAAPPPTLSEARTDTAAAGYADEEQEQASDDPVKRELADRDNSYMARLADEGQTAAIQGEKSAADEKAKLARVAKNQPAKPARGRYTPKGNKKRSKRRVASKRKASGLAIAKDQQKLIITDTNDSIRDDSEGDDIGPAPQTEAPPESPAPAPPPGAVAQSEKASDKLDSTRAKQEQWARIQHKRLLSMARAKRCTQVARLANDIRDRAASYYQRNVHKSSAVRGCTKSVVAERQRRVRERSNAGGGRTGSAKAAPEKTRRAAPAEPKK